MRIAIFSRGRTLYSTRRLAEVARRRNHDVRVIDAYKCMFGIEDGRLVIDHDGLSIDNFDVVIPRVGTSSMPQCLALLRQFEKRGIPTVNSAASIVASKDKFHAHQIMATAGLPVPRTFTTRNEERIDAIVERLGGPPIIIKINQGTQGLGVIVAGSIEAVRSTTQTLWSLDQELMFQEYVAESAGRDIRLIVAGDYVVGGMRRHAPEGEFRANLHRGGTSTAFDYTDEMAEIAVKAARSLSLDVAGIDMLESNRGPLLLEANASPGLQGIESATNFDIARAIIRHTEEKAALP